MEQIQGFFKNKTFLMVAGIVVVAGIFMYMRNKNSTVTIQEGYGGEVSTGDVSSDDVSQLASSLESVVDYFSDRYESQSEQIQDLQSQLLTTTTDTSSIVPDNLVSAITTAINTAVSKVTATTKQPTSTSSTTSKTATTATKTSTKKYFTVQKYTGSKASAYVGTLGGIAIKFKTTVSNLLKLNPSIKDPNKIYVGQKLRVA